MSCATPTPQPHPCLPSCKFQQHHHHQNEEDIAMPYLARKAGWVPDKISADHQELVVRGGDGGGRP